ncbi:aminotransferase class I/II-fold pyridoxal phosphate-dependent enzyme [Trinickia dinghuensis]|uniref:Aminotransferase class I/II-fold pyridoxal phosphate-dependent enzyme n=1 Tax=Trinickia dinghuensis TaxID=2291023 RepID=A0A3D8JWM9_9BURK|nr:aminotransferase class I/II-fold pyridoxal phosphate-dependent enzyme [Trinickia dinghuensis]RDU97026.1 aminotransferase class I/II-fold pyridoxal phosphate-dependent enzyme [Trinickia dinghuensis]
MTMTYDAFKAQGLSIDMTRGKPAAEQLDLSQALIDDVGRAGFLSRDGIDCRNYGHVLGLPEARELGAQLLGLPATQVVAAGNSSLELMHDALAFAMLHGTVQSGPWGRAGEVAFLCPVPGYDRHFAICEALGIRMIAVPMNDDGPDMERVESLVAADPAIKGIWCTPLYSNPTGAIYSRETVRRLAGMPAAAPDFRLLWDDAYRFHHLTDERYTTPDIVAACAEAGHHDRALVFASTSKVTFGSAGLALFASSPRNVDWWQRCVSVRTIGPDKLNQLRHVHYLRDRAGLERLMDRHRAILQPKFEVLDASLHALLGDVSDVSWTKPKGGYFVSLFTPDGMAKRTVELAAQAGVVLTPAGAAFPYRVDPRDRHLRIAPSCPNTVQIEQAAMAIALSLRRALDEGARQAR